MAGRDRDDQRRSIDVTQPGQAMAYAVVAFENGRYFVRFAMPTGRLVIVGGFRSEEDARAWIGPVTALPKDS